ncbi:hypothetical protein CP973_14035 [Streptomyces albofaciens JCM 4342]|uniref:hypothetical protein n=1 Tax=Streptomyces albofaciens TaxID=66866 RepID=UPI0012386BBE|nr:hypothetical protein [Streptomyces albofaciens]KAA6222894.1 hypothetical protein CP973_14035 [Streptomyces albofaciens JCM 4342]
MTYQRHLTSAAAVGLSSVLALGFLDGSAAVAAAGQCGGSANDYVEAPQEGARASFELSKPYTQDGTKVRTVQFNADHSLTVEPTNSSSTADGFWLHEPPNGGNSAKKGVVTFMTRVTTSDGGRYQTVFTVPVSICNPRNRQRPTNVFQIRGDRTLTYTAPDGRTATAADAAYQADR